ncbi:hypothetical protein PFICI_06069 [Pestalotiopsis fici W106-1]|uniref:Zn(2)-C6 fungal-type domain-containing protein n=1 Tax=Pestalotiopsis fici (strain W106-1 / CGMCC3.15140) TaxID=1229662 RepID=W3X6N8_PESFW|nr:uncharacterized protein PFICI_06069 [Pestalotiopsis fici W106-1]ETS81067.1 hypothetical protein PFICI_06069 [Pestalotiopsis fici W106-1]
MPAFVSTTLQVAIIMPSNSTIDLQHRKACQQCTKAKRKCDKQIPTCRRCIRKRAHCQYPTTRRYERKVKSPRQLRGASNDTAGPQLPVPIGEGATVERCQAEPAVVGSFTGCDDSDMAHHSLELLSPIPVLPVANPAPMSNLDVRSWFCGPDAWSMNHHIPATSSNLSLPSSAVNALALKQWVESIRGSLRYWIEFGHNIFIHKHLYLHIGLPSSLQDAWMALTAYHSKTKENEEITLTMVGDRAQNYILQQSLMDNITSTASTGDVWSHLVRVQTLFIYQFIRLFDGDIRQRALAEKQIPTLDAWSEQLWQQAQFDAELMTAQSIIGSGSIQDDGHDDSEEIAWNEWILSESVRRIRLLVNFMHGVYLTLRDGWVECNGAPKFTARKGLWDAVSSADWTVLLRNKGPLFVSLNQIDQLTIMAKADEVETFSFDLLSASVNHGKLDTWIRTL